VFASRRQQAFSAVGCSAAVVAACSLLAPNDDSLLAERRPDGGVDSSVADAGADREDAASDGRGACVEWQQCGAGEYCARGRCQPCADLSSISSPADLVFAAPEPLAAMNADAGLYFLRYPRIFGEPPQLTYTRDYFGGQLWLTEDFASSAGAAMTGELDVPTAGENGALRIGWPLAGSLSGVNFFFNRNEQSEAGALRVDIYGAVVDAAGTATRVVRLPQPFNGAPGSVRSSYGLALSRSHAFWTINEDGALDVHTYSMKLADEGTPTDIRFELPGACVLGEFEYGLWAVPDAPWLFFSARERNASCKPLAAEPYDVFVVKLNDAGVPAGPAVSVTGVNQSGVLDMDPSLSPDLCWMYFASDRDTPKTLRLFRAHRLE
jgi:hypothetical protein